jgi:hypothetical protein
MPRARRAVGQRRARDAAGIADEHQRAPHRRRVDAARLAIASARTPSSAPCRVADDEPREEPCSSAVARAKSRPRMCFRAVLDPPPESPAISSNARRRHRASASAPRRVTSGARAAMPIPSRRCDRARRYDTPISTSSFPSARSVVRGCSIFAEPGRRGGDARRWRPGPVPACARAPEGEARRDPSSRSAPAARIPLRDHVALDLRRTAHDGLRPRVRNCRGIVPSPSDSAPRGARRRGRRRHGEPCSRWSVSLPSTFSIELSLPVAGASRFVRLR